MGGEKYVLGDFSNKHLVLEYVKTFNLEACFTGEKIGVDQSDPEQSQNRLQAVDPGNFNPIPPNWSDLARLHWLTRARRAVSVVEFGAGYSTSVIAHALMMNQDDFGDWARSHRRVDNPFTVLSVDQSDYWLEKVLLRTASELRGLIRPHKSSVSMGSFQDRACTYYEELPNFVADLVYLDGPDQYAPGNSIRGFSTSSPNLMPMAGDLLTVEHFFEPGAVVLVDGRTANARFLKGNFQRAWSYRHFPEEDFHLFELDEPPLGGMNATRLSSGLLALLA